MRPSQDERYPETTIPATKTTSLTIQMVLFAPTLCFCSAAESATHGTRITATIVPPHELNPDSRIMSVPLTFTRISVGFVKNQGAISPTDGKNRSKSPKAAIIVPQTTSTRTYRLTSSTDLTQDLSNTRIGKKIMKAFASTTASVIELRFVAATPSPTNETNARRSEAIGSPN